MNKRNYGLYAIAVAIVLVGALTLGVPLATWGFLTIVVVACPLMMLFMMRGMHGGSGMHGGHGPTDRDEDQLHKRDHPTGPGRV